MLSKLLLTSIIRLTINSVKLVETKKELTWWERVSPNETCMRVREGCVWAFYGARSMVERCYNLSKTFWDFLVRTSATGVFWGIKRLSSESPFPLMGIVFLGQDWSFQVEDDLKTPIFWCFL